MHSSLPGRADSARLMVAVLLAVLLHLALAQVPIAWRAPVAPLAAPIQISLLSPPAAPPAAAPGPATPGPAVPAPPAAPVSVAEIVPVPQAAPSKPESKPEPPEPRRPVVTTKVAKPHEPIRPVAKPKPVKPKPVKSKPVKSKPVKPKSIQPAESAPDPPVRLAAHHPISTPASPSSMAGGGGLRDGAVGGASASREAGGAPSTTEAKLRPLPGNPQPRYPSLARRRGEEGRVLLRLTVNATGQVEAVSVARSSGYELLDQEAQRTVARWRFQSPPTERMVAQIPITFRLRD
jgi:protein TonB